MKSELLVVCACVAGAKETQLKQLNHWHPRGSCKCLYGLPFSLVSLLLFLPLLLPLEKLPLNRP